MTTLSQKRTLTVMEVALYFNVTQRTVYLWIEHKKLEAINTPGGAIRIPREAVERFMLMKPA